LDGLAQSDDQLQREPENLFVGRLLQQPKFGFCGYGKLIGGGRGETEVGSQ
jgi:hypothetical protein